MEKEALLVAHCPTCDKYTEQKADGSGTKSCFICGTAYTQPK